MSNMQFSVNPEAVISNIFNTDIQARMYCKCKYSHDPEEFLKALKRYEDANIIGIPTVTSFMKKYPNVFKNTHLITSRHNVFEDITSLAPYFYTNVADDKIKSTMNIIGDVSEEEIENMQAFFQDFHQLSENPEIQAIIQETEAYKREIQRLWKRNESEVLNYIEEILGYKPEIQGETEINVMCPNVNTNKVVYGPSHTKTNSQKTYFLFSEREATSSPEKIIASIAHFVVHQQILPYKLTMTKEKKETFHAFIKFLTNKEIYYMLKQDSFSPLEVVTPRENAKVMAKVYPYWLGYRYRMDTNPVDQITKAIARDKAYVHTLAKTSKKRKLYEDYAFDQLDAHKIAKFTATFFKYKKNRTLYEWNDAIRLQDSDNIYKKEDGLKTIPDEECSK